MINTTERIIILAKGNLNDLIRQSLDSVYRTLEHKHGRVEEVKKSDKKRPFMYLFGQHNLRTDAVFDEEFLQQLLTFSMTVSQNNGARAFFEFLSDYLNDSYPAASAISSIKQNIKHLLVSLWDRQAILLPTVFGGGSKFIPPPIANELYTFVMSYASKVAPEGHSESMLLIDTSRRMFSYMPRILWATTWRAVEDVSIFELAELHREQCLFIAGKSTTPFISSRGVPWSLFLSELFREYPGRVSYSDAQLKAYSRWAIGMSLDYPFSEHESVLEERKKARSLRERLKSPKAGKAGKAESALSSLCIQPSHEAALRYFAQFVRKTRRGLNWINCEPIYPGREHVKNSNQTRIWREMFQAFLHHRKTILGYEAEDNVISSLNIFSDYLFLYLPWWKEIYPESNVDLPESPKTFGRYAFINRSAPAPLEKYPITFPEAVRLRRPSSHSQYQALKHIDLFFKFVEAEFSDDESVAGKDFRNPIISQFDQPRLRKPTKTTKVVFPKNSYGYLIYYGYAVEAFGEFIQQKCLDKQFSQVELRKLSTTRWFETETYGFVPFVRYRGKLTRLTRIPNVFTWANRQIEREGRASEQLFIPHLTTLRLLISATETGLRLIGLRWLDQRTWDKGNLGSTNSSQFSYAPSEKNVYKLSVSTDKMKDGAWETLIVYRVRSLLLREQEFQMSIDEPDINDSIPYEDREHSRFGQIVPLFRSAKSSHPINESLYHDYWVAFLTGFQEFFQSATGSFVQFVMVKPTCTASGKSGGHKEIVDDKGLRNCPVSILAINTPHSCRATYATNRNGLLETSDIAELLGHASPDVTTYYQSPRAEDLQKKLADCDRAIFDDYRLFDPEDEAYIRPDKQESSLVRSFLMNRDATLKQFGFMPSISLWSTADSTNLDEDGMKMLREGPMSLIRFRETHICPVGEECPLDIVQKIGSFRRCGLCPLAMKCVDHLPSIAAKISALHERIQYLTKHKKQLEEAGEITVADALWDEMELEANEMLAWKASEELLAKIYQEKIHNSDNDSDEVVYHVERPDIVRRLLQSVTRKTEQADFLLLRIAESNAYPSLQTPQIQAIAANFLRSMMAGNSLSGLLTDVAGPIDVTRAAAMLKTAMQANQLSIADMGKLLTDNTEILPYPMFTKELGTSDEE
ncbi:MAG: hypothetical protein Q8K12_13050 [Thiobacillus sp.]|nr:hypothetical protein [Thiobacillus sp.]